MAARAPFVRLRAPASAGDVVLAVALTVVAQVDVWAPELAVWGDDPVPGARPVNALLFLLVTGAVAWRRTAPLGAVTVMGVAVSVQALLSQDAPIGLLLVGPVLVLVYAVGCYGDRREAWSGLAVTAMATAVHDALDADIRSPQDVGDASYWWLVVASTWLVGRYVGSRRRAREHERRAQAREEELVREEREAVAAERLRIANELHDVVAHGVSVIALQAGAALELLERSPERVREPLEAIERTAREALAEMGALVGILRQGEEPGGVQPSLQELPALVDRARATGLDVELTTEGTPRTLPSGIELSAYRIVQEAVTNALKHAGPGGRADVVLTHRSDELVLTITSTGTGRSSTLVEGRGHGLVGMRERTALYGGRLRTGPTEDGGFRVEATLPLDEAITRSRVRS